MEKNIEIENIKRISEPKRSSLAKYPYIVHVRTVSGKLQRKYFVTNEDAWRFYNETRSKMDEQSKANQSAEDIIDYRKAQKVAYSLGISIGTMVDMYVAAKTRLKEIGIDSPDAAIKEYLHWRKYNDPTLRFSTLIPKFCENYKVRGMRDVSITNARIILNKLLGKMGDMPITAMTPKLIQECITTMDNHRYTMGSSPSLYPIPKSKYLSLCTQHCYLRVLQSFFSYCKKQCYISTNPCVKVQLPTLVKNDPKAYTPEDVAFAINLFKDKYPDVHLYVCLAAFTGIRPAELGKLTWQSFDMDEKSITLDMQTTKTTRRRVVKMPENLLEWLAPWKEFFGKDRPLFKSFASTHQRFLYTFRMHRRVIHDGLRHSCASYLLALTKNSELTAEQLGHTPKILKTHYMDLVREKDAIRYFNIRPTTIKKYL